METLKQALALGSNEKRIFVKENLSDSAIKQVQPKGYAYLKVSESDILIRKYFNAEEPTEAPEATPEAPEKAPEAPKRERRKATDNTEQATELAKMLSQMMQAQSAQLDPEEIREIIAEEVAKQQKGVKRIKVEFEKRDIPTPEASSTRENFEYMVHDLVAGNNLLLSGPTGTGKTVLAKELAKACGVQDENIYLVSCEPFTFKGDFWGAYKSATEYVEGAFEKASKDIANGLQACVILDEMTKLDPECAGTLNAPLAHTKDRKQFFTSGKGVRYEMTDVLIIATTNTWGKGYSSEYVGNAQQDASLLSRFSSSKYFVDYDKELEKSLVHTDVFARLDGLRSKMLQHEIRHTITLRDMVNVDTARQVGKPLEVSVQCLTADWSEDERAKVGL